ncbi:MAG: hypothetical protein IPK20_19165 [Betaproteobacteria bacterium]|nr:hypothetical protein [Betaproteobacteria bacterium]
MVILLLERYCYLVLRSRPASLVIASAGNYRPHEWAAPRFRGEDIAHFTGEDDPARRYEPRCHAASQDLAREHLGRVALATFVAGQTFVMGYWLIRLTSLRYDAVAIRVARRLSRRNANGEDRRAQFKANAGIGSARRKVSRPITFIGQQVMALKK